mmetsp:Transcript_32149/g.48529  ORF Transcript_32149/g.48529 Transcript_32149/m.48529 type:complete len:595 (-) Transcript_32149:226-2010(-)|eukprot:CAMPEP_0178910578 /NCGR_PEP_ID=MMETSP0786-20121207/9174_1 /TAXON_ID=186022 /ORGANISM="Thalassionema frauenfeldii, Strain CCMP 1798" /LENGTH=594 /DNA_ID=CAMNT_0020582843 /DNA_START=23 /DNA_END=1804 /DNA_ORIENTATION=+
MSPVFLSNVDDYVAPSQACVNPLFADDVNKDTKTDNEGSKGLVVPKKRHAVGRKQESRNPSIATSNDNAVGTVTMADCLACSGCVTSAETILVEQHSLKMLDDRLATSPSKVVATISPAAWADIMRHLEIPENEIYETKRCISMAMHKVCGASLVLDGKIPLQWSLLESGMEFCDAYLVRKEAISKIQSIPPPSIAISSNQSKLIGRNDVLTHVARSKSHLPLISSSCPALVCWIEKSQADLVPHLSTSKSPMAMAGTYLSSLNDDIFHFAIMPCHDKKLEASRKDFFLSKTERQEVDLVLTTQEWFELLCRGAGSVNKAEVRSYIQSLEPAPVVSSLNDAIHKQLESVSILPEFYVPTKFKQKENTKFFQDGSGGYADFIFRFAAKKLFGYSIALDQTLPWKHVGDSSEQSRRVSARVASLRKRQQLYSVSLYKLQRTDEKNINGTVTDNYSMTFEEGAQTVLKFAVVNGYQTLQRILQPPAPKSDHSHFLMYDYIEAMACPYACLNGGGQLRLVDRETPKETRQRVAETQAKFAQQYHQSVIENQDIYTKICPSGPFGIEAQCRLHTRYHVVPPLEHSTGAVAGVAINDTQW